jgi:hypothetical protein
MVAKKFNLLDFILTISITGLITLFISLGISQSKINKKEEQIKNLEALVEYHQQQTFDLLGELTVLKNSDK